MGSNLKNNISGLVDYGIYKIISIVVTTLIIIAYLFLIFLKFKFIYIIHLTAFTVSFFTIIDPLFIYVSKLSKGEDVNNKENTKLIVLSLLVVCLFGNIYNIVYSGEKILYLSYIFIMLSGILLIVINQYNKAVKIIKDEKKKNKLLSILESNLFLILYLFIFFINSNEVFLEEKVISLDDIKSPTTVSIYKHEENYPRRNHIDFNSLNIIKIENIEIIDKLNKQLEGKQLENLRGIPYLDYSLKTVDKYPYYSMTFVYNQTTGIRKDLEKGYITYIKLYNDGKVIIREFDHDAREYQRYSTFISKELAKQIISLSN